MTWVTWRHYRYRGALAAALLAALAVLLLITGLHAAHVWHSALSRCTVATSCGGLAGSGLRLSSGLVRGLVIATAAVPVLPALFWGAPAVAQELETGTHQLAWTQSITRRRWLLVTAGWLLLGTAVLSGAAAALVTWWSGPDIALRADAFQTNIFDIRYIVPVGYALFAMALAICAGALLRRTLPAFAVTLAGFTGLRVLVANVLRPHYLTPVTVYYKLTTGFTPPGSFLQVSQGIVTASHGQLPAGGRYQFNGITVPADCVRTLTSRGPRSVMSCLTAHGYQGVLSYQPASRFWTFQGFETGIFVLLAVILLAVAYWTLTRRDA